MERTTIRIHPLPGDKPQRIAVYEGMLFEMGCRISAQGWQARSGFPSSPDRRHRIEADIPPDAPPEDVDAFLRGLPNVLDVRREDGEIIVTVSSYRWPDPAQHTFAMTPLMRPPLGTHEGMDMITKIRRTYQRLDQGDIPGARLILAELENLIQEARGQVV